MCKYEMDLASIVEDTEWKLFRSQTDGQMDKRTHKVKPVYPPFNFVGAGGMIIPLIAGGYFSIIDFSP